MMWTELGSPGNLSICDVVVSSQQRTGYKELQLVLFAKLHQLFIWCSMHIWTRNSHYYEPYNRCTGVARPPSTTATSFRLLLSFLQNEVPMPTTKPVVHISSSWNSSHSKRGHEDVWRREGKSPRIINFETRCSRAVISFTLDVGGNVMARPLSTSHTLTSVRAPVGDAHKSLAFHNNYSDIFMFLWCPSVANQRRPSV
jgi:hypothetical protein